MTAARRARPRGPRAASAGPCPGRGRCGRPASRCPSLGGAGRAGAGPAARIEGARRSWQGWAEAALAGHRMPAPADAAEGVRRFHVFEADVEGLEAAVGREETAAVTATEHGIAVAVVALLG